MLLLIAACAPEPPEWYYGEDLHELVVVPVSWEEGVYPDTSVLGDPANPFVVGADLDPNGDLKWEVLATDCAAGFYAFGTALALAPTGENQFYTSHCLQTLYDAARLRPEDTYWGWSAAVRGYQQVLDSFPGSVTYDATGTEAWPLAPLAYDAIVSMGATPEGWVKVVGEDGQVAIVPTGSAP